MLYLTRMCLQRLCCADPSAAAVIRGGAEYPEIRGSVSFYEMRDGCIVMTELVGLPDGAGPFPGAAGYFRPEIQNGGELPPLFSSCGYAWSAVYTERFYPEDLLGLAVIIREIPDGGARFTQERPGKEIACGKIMA